MYNWNLHGEQVLQKNRFFFGSEWTWRITLLRRNHGFWVYTLFLWKQGKRVRSFEPTFINLLKKSITAGVKTTGLGWIPNDFSILAQSFRGRQSKPETNLFFFPQLSLLVPVHGYRLFWKCWTHCTVSLNLNLITVRLYFVSQVIDVDVLHMLEEIEKKSEVDDILNYRSVAERELQVCMQLKELVIIAKTVLHCNSFHN